MKTWLGFCEKAVLDILNFIIGKAIHPLFAFILLSGNRHPGTKLMDMPHATADRRTGTSMERPSIYGYLNYRIYLADMFRYRKTGSPYFSYRFFSGKAGFASPNFLKLVTDGQRNLTSASIAKIAKGFGLKKMEREYFEQLVFMNQADSHEEKNHYFKRMTAVAGAKRIGAIHKDQYDYFSKWYYPAIREMTLFDPDLTAEGIAARLTPKISRRDAQSALHLLEKLQLIQKDKQGRWRQVRNNITTGPEVQSLMVANFHREMMRLAEQAIEHVDPAQRDISALTLSIPQGSLPELKARIALFRKELMASASTEEAPNAVVQVNIQLFPLTL